MSTVKISELPVLSSANAADEFVVVDDSAGVTKKITAAALNGSLDVASLDDYEEGTWTPVIDNASGFDTTIATLTSATYIKIGGFIYLNAKLNNGASGSLVAGDDIVFTLACLPYAPSGRNRGAAVGVAGVQVSMGTGEDIAMGYAGLSGDGKLGLVFHTVDGGVNRDSGLSLSIFYEVL